MSFGAGYRDEGFSYLPPEDGLPYDGKRWTWGATLCMLGIVPYLVGGGVIWLGEVAFRLLDRRSTSHSPKDHDHGQDDDEEEERMYRKSQDYCQHHQ